MKRQIRIGVFETNSSSVHTLSIVSEKDFERWEDGELLFSRWDDKFVEASSVTREKYVDEWDGSEYYDDDGYQTYDEWLDDDYLEYYIERYTTESGDKIVAFGKYGHD